VDSDFISFAIYVLPTEEGKPPRAILIDPTQESPQPIEAPMLIWSRDMGTWTQGGVPVPQELADTCTEHAKSLGVQW